MKKETVRGVGGGVVAAALIGTILLGIGAFWLSFTALADLAERAGTPVGLAWVWPLIVDGVIVIATMSVVALSRHGAKATRYPWLLLAGAALVSVSANITHALVAADDDVPGLLAALVASVPPLVLLAVTHLTVELGRHHHAAERPRPAGTIQRPLEAPGVAALSSRETKALTGGQAMVDEGRTEKHQAATPSRGTARAGEGRSSGDQDEAARLRREGLSNREIATRLGVHPSTVGRWMKTTRTAPEDHDDATDSDAHQEG